ncbi:MAG TPA: tetratricopeptide repeat protein [Kiritimatiellia bacterium]|nr:tetratricopeptide repeat protein [Kiritimatiellia bacterium]HSA19496.1 tetratricopeptide repeat protein [Kiritimatiellia bacterium]
MAEILLDAAPRKARELYEKAMAAMERGNLDYAMDMFTSALEIEPRLLRARKFLRAAAVKKFKDAKGGAVTHAISSLTGLPQLLAVKTQLAKKPAEALKSAEKLIRKDPLNLTFVNLLAQAAVAAEMPEVAIQTLEIARDHYPKNVDILKDLGRLYIETNQTHEARTTYETLNELRPNDPMIIKALKDTAALDTMKKGGWTEAGSYRDVMKDAKEAVILEQESKAVKSEKDISSLIVEMQGKAEREPENVNYKRHLADLLARADRYEEALAVLTEAHEATGKTDPQIDRALSALRLRHFDFQIEGLQKAGDAAGAGQKTKEKDTFVLEDAADRVKRYPNDLQYRYDLGVILFERERLNEAIQEFQLAQRNPQRRIRSLYYLAMCFKQKNQLDIAMEQLQKAASELSIMDDTKKDILYEMGSVAEQMGRREEAAKHYKEIYSVDIGYRDVAAKIEKAYSS